MRKKRLTLEEAKERCKRRRQVYFLEKIDIRKIVFILKNADKDYNIVKLIENSDSYSTLYKLSYDAVRELTEALLRFDKLKSINHQCLFMLLCERYDYSWDFFDKARLKRNGINYEGEQVSKKDWDEVKDKFEESFESLKQEIKRRIDKYCETKGLNI